MKINIGKYKVLFDRQRGYMQLINSCILIYLLLDKTGFQIYYLLVLPVIAFLIYYDNKKIIAEERDYVWTRPGKLNDMLNDIKEIKRNTCK